MASAECSHETKECTRRVFEAVNQNSVSLLQSARKTYSEIQLLISLAECNEEGETPLAIAIKSNYVSVVDEIMRFMELDCNIVENEFKLTFVINQLLLQQIPIKELIDVLIVADTDIFLKSTEWLMFIAKIFLKSNSLTRQDTIILLELIGSVIITQLCDENFEEETVLYGNCGLECWRKAMTLRYFPTDGGDLLLKLPNVLVPSELTSVIFGSAVEVATIEELDLLQKDFERNYFPDADRRLPCVKRMLIQAFLVIRRITTQEHLGHPHWFYLESLATFADVFMDSDDNIGIKPCLFILEELNGFDPNLLPLKSFDLFTDLLDMLSLKFVDHLSEPPNSPRGRELNYANLLMVTKWITSMQSSDFQFENVISFHPLLVVYRLVFVMKSISSRITSEEQQKLEKFYGDFFRDFPERTTTVLHVAVVDNICDSTNYERLQTIQRLLQFGADPNAIDEKGQNPLHLLAAATQFTDENESVPLFQALLEAETHLDAAGDDGKTVLCILKEKLRGNVHHYFESLIKTVFSLSCCCARVIRRHGIPLEDWLPPHLKKLISSHNAKALASIDLHQPPPGGC
uniref:Ankyrin repeat domain-containing protein 54 n=1 Tax=Daphnia galeata TaxID=27404 RepID=A0A8J2RSR1_9CRUS|nr:unnamed protein product [Daphnia galeata]